MTEEQMYFNYGQKEIDYLKSKDKTLAKAIDTIGMIQHPKTPDLFQALVHSIVGQQLSTKAQTSIWQKMNNNLSAIDAQTIANIDANILQKCGLSFRKVEYMQDIAQKIISKEFDINGLYPMSDEQVYTELSKLRGIGVWTAEMIMIFSMQRSNN